MKKLSVITLFSAILLFSIAMSGNNCVRIKDGILEYSAGHYLAGTPLKLGFDEFGYNYQAHLFNGSYANVYLGRDGFPPYEGDDETYLAENPTAASHWAWPYRKVWLSMKWNDAWLSNRDCDGDGELDRHYGYIEYPDSGAWLTNHMVGSEDDGSCSWTYFTKIITSFSDWNLVGGTWYDADGNEIGPAIWGAFATILEVSNDPCNGLNGVQFKSPSAIGFGKYGPKKP